MSLVFAAVLWRMFRCSGTTALLLALWLPVSNLYQYALVFFRLKLDFRRTFLANVLVSLASAAGALAFATEELWPLVFLLGDAAGLVYTAIVTPFLREPFRHTPLLGESVRMLAAIMLSGLVGNLLLYADRMIIYPILGPESVSYYSTASFFGKSAGVVLTPIAGVLLSYFAQRDFRPSRAPVFPNPTGCPWAAWRCFSCFAGCWRLGLPGFYTPCCTTEPPPISCWPTWGPSCPSPGTWPSP